MIHFNQPNFSEQVACIVENDLILESLYDQLKNLLNVQVKNLSRLEACKLPKDGVKKSEVTLKSGEEFSCDLLVSRLFHFLFKSFLSSDKTFVNSSTFFVKASTFVSTSLI
jgi:hypothetical protein